MRRLSLVMLALAPTLFGYIRLNTGETPPVPLQRIDSTGIQFYLNNLVVPGVQSSASGSNVTVIAANANPTQAIGLAQATWNSVATANVKFLPVKSTTLVHNPNDNTNVISIAASASDLSAVSGVVALTISVWANGSGPLDGLTVQDGDILDSDILLNPQFSFSSDGSTKVDLQAVLTHEFGHVLTANHTGLLGATMFQFTAFSQRYLSEDDLTFVSEVYPAAGSAAAAVGTISGTVTIGSITPVPYALLTMIDVSQGITIGGIASSSGAYSLQVPPGFYFIYAEPFNTIVQPGNIYFGTTTLASQAGAPSFQATFFGGNTSPTTVAVVAGGGATANITVTPGATTLAPPSFVAVVPAGAFVSSASSINGPLQIASGQTVDLVMLGPGYDSTLTTANFHIYGPGVSITKVTVDQSEKIGGFFPLRATLTITARQNADVATIFINNGGASLSLSGVLVITPPTPVISSASLVSAASYLGSAPGKGGISPGGIYSVYTPTGSPATLGPATPVGNAGYDPYGFLSTRLAGVTVTFNGVAAPLFFVYNGQINVQVPFEVAGTTSANVVVNYFGSTNAAVSVPVLNEQPAFFTSTAEGTDSIIVNPDGITINSKTNPAARGGYVTAYGTGIGIVTGLITGQGAPLEPTLSYTCTIGSAAPFPAYFVGWTPTAVGLAQFTFQVPSGITANSTQTLTCTDTATGVSTLPGTLYVGN